MTLDNENLLKSILASLDRFEHIHAEDIPNIELYMDQVTTLMDTNLRRTTRDPNEDKILTKTMINNYAKNNLLPPPNKKKYSKEHILVLIFIYYFKGILSISDIQELMNPITDQFFDTTDNFDLERIYEEIFGASKKQLAVIKQDIVEKFELSEESFPDAPKNSKEYMKLFSFICMIGFDVYVKKLLIEKLIDEIREHPNLQMKKTDNGGKSANGKKAETSKKTENVKKQEVTKTTKATKAKPASVQGATKSKTADKAKNAVGKDQVKKAPAKQTTT